ncbi:MAG: ribosomal protein [Planctomycetota bacterium]|nr:ribosomal protein [Planctomycetota bacterium]
MSKYVKEMMMDQLKTELDGSRSVLILDFKGLDAVAENKLRLDLRKKKIHMRAVKNTLARRVFSDAGIPGLEQFLTGPSVAVWGGDGVAELAKEISAQVKKLKKPEIKGGAVDGVVITANQVADITKLPSREILIGRVVSLALAPVQRVITLANSPASGILGQLKTLAEGAEAEAEANAEADAAAEPAQGDAGTEPTPAAEPAPAPEGA